MKLIIKSLLAWVLIIPLAILNGGLREKILIPTLGQNIALPLSGVLLCLLILLITVFVLPKLVKVDAKTYWRIGLLWVTITIIFEFAMGVGIGKTLHEMLSTYDISTGNLWLLVVVFTGIAPWLGAKISKTI